MITTYFILGAFLLGTLALGLWAGRDVKTMKDYVLANRSLSTAVVTMSLMATCIGSGSIGMPHFVYYYGINSTIFPLFFFMSLLLVGAFIAPNMAYFQNCLTIGDIMHNLYGKGARLFTGVISFLFCLLIICSQLRAISYISSYLLGLSNTQVSLGIGIVIVLYTSFSGMRGVAYTDVLQFICMLMVFTSLTIVLIYKIGSLQALFSQVPKEKLSLLNSQRPLQETIIGAIFWYLIPTYLLSPPIVMRMLMVQDKRKVSNMFFSSAVIYGILKIMLTLLGLGAIVYFNNSSFSEFVGKRKATGFIGYVANKLFEGNEIIQISVFIGLLFVLVSTIDSFLHSVGITIVHDIIKPFTDKKKIVINEIKWSKWAIFLIGILSVLITFAKLDLIVRFNGDSIFLMNLILVPLILGVMGLKTNKKSLLVFSITLSSILGMSSLFIGPGRYFRYMDIPFLISIGIATLLFFISHYIINKGFVTVQRTHHTTSHKLWLPSWHGVTTILASCIPTPSKLANIAQRRVSNYGSEPFLFSLFFICASPIILLNIPQAPSTLYITTLVFGMAITLCCGLMLEAKWLFWLKSYFPLYWFFTLLYCLPFAGTLLFLTNAENSTAMVSLGLAWFVLMLCVDWKSFFILTFLGTSVASGVYGYMTGSFWPMMDFGTKWNFYLAVIAVLTACFLFVQRKERYNKIQLQKANLYAGSIAHETKNYLSTSRFAGVRINEAIKKKQLKALDKDNFVIPKQLAEDLMLLGPELEEGANQSLSKINMFMNVLKENIISAKLSVRSAKACVEEALKDGYFKGQEVRKGLVLRLDDDFKARVPEGFFKHVVYNLVKNAYWHGGATQVVIRLDAAGRSLYVEDNGVGVDAVSLPYIFDLFYSGGSGSGVGLALVKVIVEGFGGSVHCDSKQGVGSYTRFVVCFDKDV